MNPKYVWVKRQPMDNKSGKVLLSNIRDIHWDNTSGGVHAKSGQDVLYGYIHCDEIIEGEVSHSCMHGDAPHSIKVFIPMKDNDKNIIKELKEIADKKGIRYKNRNPINISDRVREIVAEHPGIIPAEIYKLIKDCERYKIDNAIHYLKKHEFKNKASLYAEKYKTTQKLYIK